MATMVWDGNGGNGKNIVWSAWNNWNPAIVPSSGDALVFSGTKKLSNYNDLGLSVPSISIQSNGFNIDGNAIALGSGGIHFTGGTTSNWGTPLAIAAASTPVEVSGSRTLNINDVIFGDGGITKTGTGTVVLNSANAFSGSTMIAGGSLRMNNPGALQQSNLDYGDYGGSLSFGSLTTATLGGLTGNQDLALVNSAGAAVALTVGANGLDNTFSGALSGAGELRKIGGGTFTLTGPGTYTGSTTVDAGTLFINSALDSNMVVVNGGTLLGSASIKSLRLAGGTISPGADIGTLTVTNGASLEHGTLDLQLNDGRDTDQLLVTAGNVVLGGDVTLSVAEGFQVSTGQVIVLINNSGIGNLSGTFSGFANGEVVELGGYRFEVRYNYDYQGDGIANDLVLVEAVNSSPVAVADTYELAMNDKLIVDAPGVLGNDTDPNGDVLQVSPQLVQSPAHGSAIVEADGGFIYVPDANFQGYDKLIYEVTDGQGGVAQAEVTIHVLSGNAKPVIGDNAFKTVRGFAAEGNLKASDTDSPTLTYSLVSGPEFGQLTIDPDGGFKYLPDANSKTNGVRFTFAVSDGETTVEGTGAIVIMAWNGRGIRPDILQWMLANNPGLDANFLKTAPPDRVVLLPNGESLPIYKLDQFQAANFNLNLVSRKKEKVNFVERQEDHLQKLMALPEFYHWIKDHSSTYRIAGKGRISAEAAYNYLRNNSQRVYVTANPRVHAPVGGGNGINAPSWAVWDQMNLLFHEICHVIGIGHNSGGLSGPLAAKLRTWDQQQRWDYTTIDVNQLKIKQ